MSWRDNLLPAQFRDAEFFVQETTTTIGRRTRVYESYKRKYPLVRDYGQKAREFQVEGYVVQNLENDFDYFTSRNKLIAALESSGPGWLIHPFFGRINVMLLEPADYEESFEEGGIAKFSMEFVQYARPEVPTRGLDHNANVDSKATDLKNKATDNFGSRFTINLPFAEKIITNIKSGMTAVQGVLNGLRGAVSSVVNESLNLAQQAIATIDSVIDTPCQIAAQFENLGDALTRVGGMGEEVVDAALSGRCSGRSIGEDTTLDGTSIPEELAVSAVRKIKNIMDDITEDNLETTTSLQSDNNSAAIDALRAIILAAMAQFAIRGDYRSQNIVQEMIDLFLAASEALMLRLGSSVGTSETFSGIDDLRAAFVENMLDKASGLAKYIDYTLPAGIITSLELAYNQYEDLDRATEIYEENNDLVNHPGFFPGGRTIRILNE